jgi:hypothetical protein
MLSFKKEKKESQRLIQMIKEEKIVITVLFFEIKILIINIIYSISIYLSNSLIAYDCFRKKC